jgi:hypothetical protein
MTGRPNPWALRIDSLTKTFGPYGKLAE